MVDADDHVCEPPELPLSAYGWFLAYLGNYLVGVEQGRPPLGWVDDLWSLAVKEQST